MYKILSAGTSFNWGLGLHFYDRVQKKIELDFNLTQIEQDFNVKNSFHSILADKLGIQSEVYRRYHYEHLPSILECLEGLKSEIIRNSESIWGEVFEPNKKVFLPKHELPYKILIFQFFNLEKDFFIYNNKIYKLDLHEISTFKESKAKLINSIEENIREDFSEKLNDDIHLWTWDREKWRKKHSSFFIDRFNKFQEYLKQNNIIFKIIAYMDDFKPFRKMFNSELYVNLHYKDIEYSCVHELIKKEKLMIKDDLKEYTEDEHPNFLAHKIVAESLYNSIIKDSLYNKL